MHSLEIGVLSHIEGMPDAKMFRRAADHDYTVVQDNISVITILGLHKKIRIRNSLASLSINLIN